MINKNKIFTVGGCVRDEILNIPSDDIDFTFCCTDTSKTLSEGFEEMTQYLKDNNFKIFLSTPEMVTIRAKFPDKNLVADFVLARKEIGYTDDSRNPKLVLGELKDDLIRRDFTVNAIAKDIDGNIIDLFGGIEDIKNKILRCPKEPKLTMLDDPLRMIRGLRFSITKDFTIEDETFKAMLNPEVLDKLDKCVSAERIQNELRKMFKHNTIKSIQLLMDVNDKLPNFLNVLFKKGLWLEPTFKSK